MILNLLRVEALRVEEMIKRSFSENASQRLLPNQQKQVVEVRPRLRFPVNLNHLRLCCAGREEVVPDAEVGMRRVFTGHRRLLRHDRGHDRSQPTVTLNGGGQSPRSEAIILWSGRDP